MVNIENIRYKLLLCGCVKSTYCYSIHCDQCNDYYLIVTCISCNKDNIFLFDFDRFISSVDDDILMFVQACDDGFVAS